VNNNLKVIHDFIFSMFDSSLFQNDFIFEYAWREYILNQNV